MMSVHSSLNIVQNSTRMESYYYDLIQDVFGLTLFGRICDAMPAL